MVTCKIYFNKDKEKKEVNEKSSIPDRKEYIGSFFLIKGWPLSWKNNLYKIIPLHNE